MPYAVHGRVRRALSAVQFNQVDKPLYESYVAATAGIMGARCMLEYMVDVPSWRAVALDETDCVYSIDQTSCMRAAGAQPTQEP